jgi:Spy/CpxP family protein refolding chaperone
MMRRLLMASAGLVALLALQAVADDDFGGLPEAEGREDVFYNCQACHSLRTVTQQSLSRSRWDQILDDMVQVHGMHELDEEERERVLDYLAEEFGTGAG